MKWPFPIVFARGERTRTEAALGFLFAFLGLSGCTPAEPRKPPPPEIRGAIAAIRNAWSDPDVYAAWVRVSCEMARIRQQVQDVRRGDELVLMIARYAQPPSDEARQRVDRGLGGVGIPGGMRACELLADPIALDSARAANGDPSLDRAPLPRSQRRKPGDPPRP